MLARTPVPSPRPTVPVLAIGTVGVASAVLCFLAVLRPGRSCVVLCWWFLYLCFLGC